MKTVSTPPTSQDRPKCIETTAGQLWAQTGPKRSKTPGNMLMRLFHCMVEDEPFGDLLLDTCSGLGFRV